MMDKFGIELGYPSLTIYSNKLEKVVLSSRFDTYDDLDKYLRTMINENKLELKHKEFEYLDIFFNKKMVIYLTKPIS